MADGEESAALVQLVLTNSIGEETELADADHSGGQHVQQKAAHELDRVQRHGLGTAAARVILPLESNAAIFQGAQAVVRARNAAGSARGRSSPEKRSVPLRRARPSCRKNFLRKRWLSTRTGRKKEDFGQAIQREPSSEMPPPGTAQCRWEAARNKML